MAKTPNSSKSESVTLRIPNELFTQIRAIAESNTRGNTSQAILQLLEAGLSVIGSSTSQTVQDINLQPQLMETRETVTALSNSVEQLTTLVQDTVLQRLTILETELMGEFNA
jgi:hypothetical protein